MLIFHCDDGIPKVRLSHEGFLLSSTMLSTLNKSNQKLHKKEPILFKCKVMSCVVGLSDARQFWRVRATIVPANKGVEELLADVWCDAVTGTLFYVSTGECLSSLQLKLHGIPIRTFDKFVIPKVNFNGDVI